MALYLRVSNSLNALASTLSDHLLKEQDSLFRPCSIVTQTAGMNNWLRSQIALRHGIAAHLQFLSPNELIQHVYRLLNGPYLEMMSAQRTRWLLFSLLNDSEFVDRFPEVAAYYNSGESIAEKKRLSLAMEVADLFDQYQIYRTEMIHSWNDPQAAAEDWQHWLWQHAQEKSSQKLPDKSVIGHYIIKALRDPSKLELLKGQLPSVHLFGLSVLTSYHIQLLEEVGEIIDVHLHMLNPAPLVYWQDDKSEKLIEKWKRNGWKLADSFQKGHSLLSSWGTVVNDAFKLFYRSDAFINSYETVEIQEPSTDTLLHRVQNDIYHAATENRLPVHAAHVKDGSIKVSACHTPMREVECLYDFIVHLFDKRKEELATKDILVLVNDIDKYADYIRAVFDHAKPSLRYYIADESRVQNDLMTDAFLRLIQLTELDFTAENVLLLIDNSFIRERFGIEKVELIRRCVREANIRSGIDGDADEETWTVSWKYGLQRIMYGLCMSGEGLYETDPYSFYPTDIVEGLEGEQLIRFVHFVELLIELLHARRNPKTLLHWVNHLLEMLGNFFGDQDLGQPELHELHDHIVDFGAAGEWFQEELSFDTVRMALEQSVQASFKRPLQLSGGITFSSMIPMRSIPHRVIAVLGMDDSFPRKSVSKSFDLMQHNRQIGDRNIKENDKHLFLETLLSAKDYLYISYVGADPRTNKELPASVMVDELLDYIQAGISDDCSVEKLLVQQQPLHRFSSKYHEPANGLYTYLQTQSTPVHFIDEERKSSFVLPDSIELASLIRFLIYPLRGYFNEVLNIYYETEEKEIPPFELFDLNTLKKWMWKKEMVSHPELNLTELREKGIRKGELPLGNVGMQFLEEMHEEIEGAKNYLLTHFHQQKETVVKSTIIINGLTIQASFTDVFNRKKVEVEYSMPKEDEIKANKKFEYALLLAFGVCADAFDELVVLPARQSNPITYRMDVAEARKMVEQFVIWYIKGHHDLIPYFKTLPKKKDFKDEPISSLISDEDRLDEYVLQAIQLKLLDNKQAQCLWAKYLSDIDLLLKSFHEINEEV